MRKIVCLLFLLTSLGGTTVNAVELPSSIAAGPPAECKLPPEKIFKSENVQGAIPTNDWWSSLAWVEFSMNQFPHPLAVRAESGGLRVSYPSPSTHATAKHVVAPMQPEFVLGHSLCDEFPDALLDGYSDWFVDALFREGSNAMRVSYGHGSPFVFATFSSSDADQGKRGAVLRFDGKPTLWSGDEQSAVLGVTIRGRHYGLFGPTGSTWSGKGTNKLQNHPGGKKYFSLALLPDNRPETLAFFAKYAYAHVRDTRVAWKYSPATAEVTTTYTIATTSYEGKEKGTLFALYPHQWKNSSTSLLTPTRSYDSVRGKMRLGAGAGFATKMRFPGILPVLPDAKDDGVGKEKLAKLLAAAVAKPLRNPEDTYWGSKPLGKLAALLAVANEAGDVEEAKKIATELRSRLDDWFTPPKEDGKKSRYFFYEKNWGTLIGWLASFGSSEQLNDHHFHYGYFIQAAAQLARTDRKWAEKNRPMVNLLVRDIASPDRKDPLFPFLRCFDPYAGHSWAAGHAKFGDGNNQESCSESMNAWTGLILWGCASGDEKIRDLGIYLYTNEMAAINNYWFDMDYDIFPKEYDQTCAALIWGGKFDYATWFSAKPEHTHGIILLPMQSGSLYLGTHPEYVTKNLECLAKLTGSETWSDWHETFWMYEALSNPDRAMQRFAAGKSKIKPVDRPLVYQWITSMQKLGHVDTTISADVPTAMAFIRGKKRTYVVWNPTAQPMTARFSDGIEVRVSAGATKAFNPST